MKVKYCEGRNGKKRLNCKLYILPVMEKEKYIQLFEKYLNGGASHEEVSLLIHWLNADGPFYAWADEQWKFASPDISPELRKELFGKIKAEAGIDEDRPVLKSHALSHWFTRVAVLLLLLLTTGASIYFYQITQQRIKEMVVSVEKGQKANIVLPDGSKVWINSGSELRYTYHLDRYMCDLHLKGEAYFEVKPDKHAPFVVHTDDFSVEALGTSFNIKAYPDEKQASVVLMTGKVEVSCVGKTCLLQPNDRLVYNKADSLISLSVMEDAANYAYWKDNVLRFRSETFENIVKTLERCYNANIVFESEELKNYRFTGNPGNTSLESILQILSLTSPLSYEVADGQIILRENTHQKAYYKKALK
jgi:ferric-dicitrate binding protein FerR (iron transport regulator)